MIKIALCSIWLIGLYIYVRLSDNLWNDLAFFLLTVILTLTALTKQGKCLQGKIYSLTAYRQSEHDIKDVCRRFKIKRADSHGISLITRLRLSRKK
jgi:hypothetical protein